MVPGQVTVLLHVATPKHVWKLVHVAAPAQVAAPVASHVVVPAQVGVPGQELVFVHVAMLSQVTVP